MTSENLLRDTFELLLVVSVGGTLFSAIKRLRRGEVSVNICPSCDRPVSRAYPSCPRCGAAQGSRS